MQRVRLIVMEFSAASSFIDDDDYVDVDASMMTHGCIVPLDSVHSLPQSAYTLSSLTFL